MMPSETSDRLLDSFYAELSSLSTSLSEITRRLELLNGTISSRGRADLSSELIQVIKGVETVIRRVDRLGNQPT